MSTTKTLGGDRLGAGKKQKVTMHGYERSNHDLGYLFRSTMAAGTLVPFLCKVGLPGDTFDISLNAEIMTHPTIGPLFGSYKVQLDVFQCPFRLYQGQLHQNKRKIGLKMANIKLPLIRLTAWPYADDPVAGDDLDNSQINSSCILKYLGLSYIGRLLTTIESPQTRDFNATAFIAYWDVYSQYYCNQQENIGAVIHTETAATVATINQLGLSFEGSTDVIPEVPAGPAQISTIDGASFEWDYTGATPLPSQIMLITSKGIIPFTQAIIGNIIETSPNNLAATYNYAKFGTMIIYQWRYIRRNEMPTIPPNVVTFPLDNLNIMREEILKNQSSTPFIINSLANPANVPPYSYITFTDPLAFFDNLINTQEGLAIKTYQSDLFNNWIDNETIDGTGGISEVTSIDTTGGSFTIDTLRLANKVNRMLNRIAVSGGTYYDWIEVTWDHQTFTRSETPIYHGGLSKELVFQEVVSNAESATQPLGTLAGKGVMSKKHKGGQVRVKFDEPGILLGIISLTPRIDYSQGNDWYIHLKTMDDLHKPELDEIGFQDLQVEEMAGWDTYWDDTANEWIMRSAGKQPAWTEYMTSVNKTFGNFAIQTNEMFMTLNRRYEFDPGSPVNGGIVDLTTYIDPAKYNHIFAQTSLDAQNFWTQVSVDIEARRKMSAKLMPNL